MRSELDSPGVVNLTSETLLCAHELSNLIVHTIYLQVLSSDEIMLVLASRTGQEI